MKKRKFLSAVLIGALMISTVPFAASAEDNEPIPDVLVEEGSGQTAVDKTEEGGDDVKSSCPLCLGLHTYYNGVKQREARPRGGAKLKNNVSVQIAGCNSPA